MVSVSERSPPSDPRPAALTASLNLAATDHPVSEVGPGGRAIRRSGLATGPGNFFHQDLGALGIRPRCW
jgi:hypothetical protein